jgi:hypothetical protein
MALDGRAARLILVAVSVLGCGGPPVATPASSAVVPTASLAAAAEPPAASLVADGGDPVVGQLGTFTWANGGSAAPWLPGAPLMVGAVEPLTLSVDRGVPIAEWRARVTGSDATDPSGAAGLGAGAGQPRFEAPVAGTWILEVQVVFAGGLGTASYFWGLTVT